MAVHITNRADTEAIIREQVVSTIFQDAPKVRNALYRVKEKTGLDVNDTEDNFKLNFIMIAKRVLEKEKKRR